MAKRMGDYMLETGAMTEMQVRVVTNLQEAGDPRRFGGIAAALGYITEQAVQQFVEYLQAEERS